MIYDILFVLYLTFCIGSGVLGVAIMWDAEKEDE